jgi:hypothetical protein
MFHGSAPIDAHHEYTSNVLSCSRSRRMQARWSAIVGGGIVRAREAASRARSAAAQEVSHSASSEMLNSRVTVRGQSLSCSIDRKTLRPTPHRYIAPTDSRKSRNHDQVCRRWLECRGDSRREAASKHLAAGALSSDILKSPFSAIFGAPLTAVIGGTQVKVIAWYDNE